MNSNQQSETIKKTENVSTNEEKGYNSEELIKKIELLHKEIESIKSPKKNEFNEEKIKEIVAKSWSEKEKQEAEEKNKSFMEIMKTKDADENLRIRNTIEEKILEELREGKHRMDYFREPEKHPAFFDVVSRCLFRDLAPECGMSVDLINESNPWDLSEKLFQIKIEKNIKINEIIE